jgi:ElaB/YqjD/DUF883 family membrane-anchored ribosome-binding protein
MGLYGDEYFINEEINFNNLMNMLESAYTVDNSMIVSIDESLRDTAKKYIEKFIEFLNRCKEAISKALEFVKRKIREIVNKIFNKTNKKVMKEAFEYTYENCPEEKEIDELERKIINYCKAAKIEDPDLTKERVADFISSDKMFIFYELTNMIIYGRRDNNGYKTAQVVFDLVNYLGSIKDIKKFDSEKVYYDDIEEESTVLDKQKLAFVYFHDNPFDKQLQKMILEYELEISKLSKEEYHNMVNTDESVQMVNEVVDKKYITEKNKSFKDMIYSKFKFPAVRHIFIPKINSSINDLKALFNDPNFNSFTNEQIERRIIEILDIKDLFKDVSSVQNAIKSSWSESWMKDIKDAIDNTMDDIFMDPNDARKYFLRRNREFGDKTIDTYYNNIDTLSNNINDTMKSYSKFLEDQIDFYNNAKYNTVNDYRSVEKKRQYLEKCNRMISSITNFTVKYVNKSGKSGVDLLHCLRAITRSETNKKNSII